MTSRAVHQARSIKANTQHFRITFGKPGGRCVSGCSHDRFQLMFLTELKRAIEYGKVIMAFFWLPNTPGAFPHSNYIHAGLANARKIEIPLRLRPLLWVVNHPVKERIVRITLVEHQNEK